MQTLPSWTESVLRAAKANIHIIAEVIDPDSRALTVAAFLREQPSTWLIVPDRDLEDTLRALTQHGIEPEVSNARGPNPGRPTLLRESWFFEAVEQRWLTQDPVVLPAAWLILDGDGFVERSRNALTRTVRNPRLIAEVKRRVRLGRLLGCTAVLPADVVRDLQHRPGLPIVNDDPNWVAFLEQEPGRTTLKSRPVEVGPQLRHIFQNRSVVVLGTSLAVDDTLTMAAEELGLEQPIEVFEEHGHWEDLTLFTPPMPETSSSAWPYAVADAAWHAIRAREGRALVFGSTMNRAAIQRAIRRPLRLMNESGAGVTFAGANDLDTLGTFPLVVIDRLPFPDTLKPVESVLRHRHLRWFESRALVKAVQTFRRVARLVELGGSLVVLDHRIRTRAYGHLFTDALSCVHITDWEGFQPPEVDACAGGAQ